MSNFIQLIIDTLVNGFNFIAGAIAFIEGALGCWVSLKTGMNIGPLFDVIPVCLAVTTIKFILKGGK